MVKSSILCVVGAALGSAAFWGLAGLAGPGVAAVAVLGFVLGALATGAQLHRSQRQVADENTKLIIDWLQSYATIWQDPYPQFAQAILIVKSKLAGNEHQTCELVDVDPEDNVVRLGGPRA